MNTEQLKNIYEKDITRSINPAVAANNIDTETIKTEITEYVFSDHIINSLYKVLDTIRGNGATDKKGIWINGYYGSGKSHFLKYIHYCMDKTTNEAAFNHLYEALEKKDLFDADTHLEHNKMEFQNLQRWFANADIDDILFNVQTFAVTGEKGQGTFTNVFFNMFNKSRGLNGSNIKLAVLLENKLKEGGNFETFVAKIEDEGFNWYADYSMLAHTELDTVLQIAKTCDSTIDVASLKHALIDPEAFQITIDVFVKELKKYLDNQIDHARIVFLVDEVSQFINNNKDVLLDLQDLVEHTSHTCGNKVIIACTAQQTMDEMADETGVSSIKKLDEIGKIMGRFETRVSLQSTDPSYITKKRILAKTGLAADELSNLYKKQENAIQAQFFTDNQQYKGFTNEEEYISCYPFIPYQFKLISKVFEGFQSKDYVQKEVKDNDRSILKITHVTAKFTKENYVGYYVPFDAFYNEMMEQNFMHKGHSAIEPALSADWGSDKAFAYRVIHVLFMISNLNEKDHQLLESTIENMTWLMIDSLDNNRKELKEHITKIIEALHEKNIIREEKGNYYFYNEDEAELSTMINQSSRDIEFELETFNKEILSSAIPSLSSKYNTPLRSFSIQVSIDGKNIVTAVNPDLKVIFTLFDKEPIESLILSNEKKCMVVCLQDVLNQHKDIQNEFKHYCRVMNYIKSNQNSSNKVRENTIAIFKKRYYDLMIQVLKPKFTEFINQALILKGNEMIEASHLTGKTGKVRYDTALNELIDLNYSKLKLVYDYPRTNDDLMKYLNQPKVVVDTEFELLSDAEKVVEESIKVRGNQITLAELYKVLDQAPYGWPTIPVLAVLIDLNKHKLRSFNYNHQKRYAINDFITKAKNKKELQSLEIVSMQRIDQQLIIQLRQDWVTIFNTPLSSTVDGDVLFGEISGALLEEQINKYQHGRNRASKFVFVKTFDGLIHQLSKLKDCSEPEDLYNKIHDQTEELVAGINLCNALMGMMKNQRFMDEYSSIINFVKTRKEDVEALGSDYSKQWQILENLLSDENPSNTLRVASKVHKELKRALEEAVSDMKKRLIKEYTEMYARINSIAETNNIAQDEYKPLTDFLKTIEDCQKVIQLTIREGNLDKEENKLRSLILELAARQKTRPVPEPELSFNDDDDPKKQDPPKTPQPAPIKPKELKHYKIRKPNRNFETAEDVDQYVNKIREELKTLIAKDNIVIVD